EDVSSARIRVIAIYPETEGIRSVWIWERGREGRWPSRERSGLVQCAEHLATDVVDAAHTLDTHIAWRGGGILLRPILIIMNQRLGLRMIDFQTLPHGFFQIVLPLHQRFAGHIVHAGRLRRVVLDVIDPATAFVDPTATEAADDFLVLHVDLDHIVDFDVGPLHSFRLRNGAGKTVKQKSVLTVFLLDALLYQGNNGFVGHQTAGRHDFLDLKPQRSACFDGGAQHVTGGNLGNLVALSNKPCLCAFSGTRGAQQNYSHVLNTPQSRWPSEFYDIAASRGGPP